MRSIVSMTPAEMHLKSFSDKLDLMPESFRQNTSLMFSVDYFDPKVSVAALTIR